jgi:hypothetical protein
VANNAESFKRNKRGDNVGDLKKPNIGQKLQSGVGARIVVGDAPRAN